MVNYINESQTNTSLLGETISIAVDKEAVAGSGIILYPGGSWEQTANSGYLPPQTRITAIASVATATLALYEEVY
jgi:hypothetical protein